VIEKPWDLSGVQQRTNQSEKVDFFTCWACSVEWHWWQSSVQTTQACCHIIQPGTAICNASAGATGICVYVHSGDEIIQTPSHFPIPILTVQLSSSSKRCTAEEEDWEWRSKYLSSRSHPNRPSLTPATASTRRVLRGGLSRIVRIAIRATIISTSGLRHFGKDPWTRLVAGEYQPQRRRVCACEAGRW
jgi:hypothetical protein